MKIQRLAVTALLASVVAAPAMAAPQSPWQVRVGVHNIDPTSDNGHLANGALKLEIENRAGPTLNVDYFFTPNIALDVLGGLPFKHNIKLNGADAGSVKELPPTVTLQYHFLPGGAIQPFVGVGANFTWIFGEKAAGPIAGTSLKVGNSVGLAAQAGVDYKIDNHWLVGADIRYIRIGGGVRDNGTYLGSAVVDPLAYGVTVGYRF